MLFSKRDAISGTTTTYDIAGLTQAQIDTWQQGTPIQTAMPSVAAVDREFILNGILPAEFSTTTETEVDGSVTLPADGSQ